MKLQVWSLDLIFAIIIFSFTVTVIGVMWLHISNGLSSSFSNTQGVLYMQSSAMSDILLSAGSPVDWQSAVNTTNSLTWTGVAPGIASTSGQPQIDPSKLYALMSVVSENYTATKAMFGIGSNYYIVIGSPGAGVSNITMGNNPLSHNATTILVNKRSAVLYGNPVQVMVEVWSNGTAGAS